MLINLNEFDFSAEHKLDHLNNVTDVLSRLSSAIATTGMSIGSAQDADDLCKQIRQQLEERPLSSDYVVIDSILYQCVSPDLRTLVLRAKMSPQALEIAHDLNRHMDSSRSLSKLQA